LECALPVEVLNLGGSLFGGFTPTYVDLISIWTCMTLLAPELAWLSTVRLEVTYLEPILTPGFRVEESCVTCGSAIIWSKRPFATRPEHCWRWDDHVAEGTRQTLANTRVRLN